MTLRDLTEQIGVTPRQVRFMIAEGFVPPPTGGRTYAQYGEKHVTAIQRYMRLRELGFTPASIRLLLQAQEGIPFPVAPGVTLVLAPTLLASGEPVEPLVERLEAQLKVVLGKNEESAGHMPGAPTSARYQKSVSKSTSKGPVKKARFCAIVDWNGTACGRPARYRLFGEPCCYTHVKRQETGSPPLHAPIGQYNKREP